MRYILYSHIGSGNRGCEATARSLHELVGSLDNELCIFSEDREEEKICGTEKYASVLYTPSVEGLHPVSSIFSLLLTKSGIDPLASVKYRYGKLFKTVGKNDIGLSTGGDVFCYDQKLADKIGYLTTEMKKNGKAVCLMACSVDEKNLTKKTLEILRKFDYIFPRESLTEKNLKKFGIDNVRTYPDPAFALPKEPVAKYSFMDGRDYIGINYSSYTNHGRESGEKYSSIIRFIRDILANTGMNIILIPHVFWNEENDLALLRKIKGDFKNEDRVIIVEDKYNSSQLKYIISKCRFFIGSRTHSVIGAYSSGVPTLALGYSIKAKGIAEDIFGDYQNVTFDSKNLGDYQGLCNAFRYVVDHESELKKVLQYKNAEFSAALAEQTHFLRKIGEKQI